MARHEHGQGSVEFVGIVAALLVAAAVAWQIILVGHAAWLAAHAARAGARAAVVGRDAAGAARSTVPGMFERGLRVERTEGAVRARVQVPLLFSRTTSPVALSASASLEPER